MAAQPAAQSKLRQTVTALGAGAVPMLGEALPVVQARVGLAAPPLLEAERGVSAQEARVVALALARSRDHAAFRHSRSMQRGPTELQAGHDRART